MKAASNPSRDELGSRRICIGIQSRRPCPSSATTPVAESPSARIKTWRCILRLTWIRRHSNVPMDAVKPSTREGIWKTISVGTKARSKSGFDASSSLSVEPSLISFSFYQTVMPSKANHPPFSIILNRPYKCHYCSKTFYRSNIRKKHESKCSRKYKLTI